MNLATPESVCIVKELLQHEIILENRRVRLEPLALHHYEALKAIAFTESLWLFTSSRILTQAEFDGYMTAAIADREKGSSYPFVVIDKQNNQVVGSTRYGNITPEHRRLEIGWTWYTPTVQGTGLNQACKFELLQFAFEKLDCIRVELKTSLLNERSRRAIAGIGAQQEGILRSHIINPDGTVRDTVMFSILQAEWAGIKGSIFGDYVEALVG